MLLFHFAAGLAGVRKKAPDFPFFFIRLRRIVFDFRSLNCDLLKFYMQFKLLQRQ